MFNNIITNDEFNAENELKKHHQEIHIRVQKRNRNKCITLIEGLDKIDSIHNKDIDLFLNTIIAYLRKRYNCGGNLKKPENIIQLMGDHGENVKEYLLIYNLVEETQIRMHVLQ